MQLKNLFRAIGVFVMGLVFLIFANSALAAAPSPPANLNVVAEAEPGTNINISWVAPPEAVDYYNIYRDFSQITAVDSDKNIYFIAGGTTNYADTDTIQGETYFYQVTAVNADGEESAIATPIISETATVAGKYKPHLGDEFSTDGAVCKFCHKIHRGEGTQKNFRKLTNIEICWTCHDGTGSDFNIKAQFNQPTSAHNNVLAGPLNVEIKCINCHHPHGKADFSRMTHKKEQELCFTCHKDGGAGGDGTAYPTAPKVKDVFDSNDANTNMTTGEIYTHPVTIYDDRHTTSFDENDSSGIGYSTMTGANRHAECTDCHNQHEAAAIGTLMGPLQGATGVLVDNGTATGVPNFTYSLLITAQYQVCFKCHSSFNPSWNATPFYDESGSTYPAGDGLPRGDKAKEFNTNNSAFHPVEGRGRNRSQNLCNQLLNGPNALFDTLNCSTEAAAKISMTTISTIDCTGCHNNTDSAISSGEARGPHGSSNQSIRKNNYWTDITTLPNSWNSSNFSLCFSCHDVGTLKPDDAGSNFWSGNDQSDGKDSLHHVHLEDRTEAACKVCHYNIHSNQDAPNTQYRIVNGPYAGTYDPSTGGPPKEIPTRMINFAPNIEATGGRNYPQWQFNTSTKQRTCNLRCHGETMAESYEPDWGDLPEEDQNPP